MHWEVKSKSGFIEEDNRYGTESRTTIWWDGVVLAWNRSLRGDVVTSEGFFIPTSWWSEFDLKYVSTSWDTGGAWGTDSHFSRIYFYIGDENGSGYQPPPGSPTDHLPSPSDPPAEAGEKQPLVVRPSAKDIGSDTVIPTTSIMLKNSLLTNEPFGVFPVTANSVFDPEVSVPGSNN